MDASHNSETEARLNVVMARAHRPLTGEELVLVRTRIERDLKLREEMRTLLLTNGDSPGADFDPRVTPGGGREW